MKMPANFYDKVAKKFGNYHTSHKYTKEYPNGEPEKVFKEKLFGLSGKDKIALDVGCGDGRFILSIASNFKKIVGIDTSAGMLRAARRLQAGSNLNNVVFKKQDASKASFKDKFFDLAYSRRGPTPFVEVFRLLKDGGYFVEIDIGEKDCREVKEVFGRGQNYGEWDIQRKKVVKQKAEKAGFRVIYSKDFLYNEYYASYKDLDLFLQGVPIFEDFDSEKDREYLKKYVDKFKAKKGIKMFRHRLVTVLQRPN